MNTVKLIGNVGKEIVVREFSKGKLATFSMATNETYTNQKEEIVKNTTWHNIVAWGKTAQLCEKMLSKGKLIAVEGKINYRSYINKENQKVYVTEIVAKSIEEVTSASN